MRILGLLCIDGCGAGLLWWQRIGLSILVPSVLWGIGKWWR